jgi:glycine betaine/proline transport system ATP-binding protein
VIRLRHEVNTTMMFITHDLSEALRLGDRIAIMRDGLFVQVGTAAEVVGAPADDYVENFVRDVSRSHVLAVEAIMTPVDRVDGAVVDGFSARVPMGTKVRDVMGRLAHHDLPVAVVDDGGTVVGTVDRVAALRLVAGEDVIDIAEEA